MPRKPSHRPRRSRPAKPEPEPELTERQRAIQDYNRRWTASAEASRPGLQRPSFQVASAIHITDPCCSVGTWCGRYDVPAVPGAWVGAASVQDAGEWGERIGELVVHHQAHAPTSATVWEDFADIGVDSGQAGVFAADRYEHDDDADPSSIENFYGRACTMTLTEPRHGCFEDGYVSSSGLGDGVYPVEVARVNGRVAAVRIRFLGAQE